MNKLTFKILNSKLVSAFTTVIILIPFLVFPQEILTGLSVNPVLKNNNVKFEHLKSGNTFAKLPFIDDFSNSGIYPDQFHWSDNNVFINNEYPVNPPTIGVATFDALDENGQIYKNANSTQFPADTLTSVAIRLDTSFFTDQKKRILPKDSVYLSFFYQPGGLGISPDPQDSLVLEFYSVKDAHWHWIWSVPGTTLDTFVSKLPRTDTSVYKSDFKKVMIPIKDSANYLRKGFRFRFRNYAAVANNYLSSWAAGNVNIWNIDYVYLDTNRRYNDSTMRDIAFKTNPGTLLKNYHSMPWKQYIANPDGETPDSISFNLHNFNGGVPRNTNEKFQIYDTLTKDLIFEPFPNGSSFNFSPLSNSLFSIPITPFHFNSNSTNKNHDFKVSAFIKSVALDFYHNNDSANFIQRFNSYYAYDDGNPEAGYGLNGTSGLIAYRFDLDSIPDTLTSVAIFFNSTFKNANHKNFNILIWNELNNLPDKIILESSNNYLPGDSGLDLFKVYPLDTMVILNNKTFFVGVRQFTKDNLNIGFDLNNDNSSKIFYNSGSGWISSMYSGSLMIRPVFGSYPPQTVSELKVPKYKLTLYPNPVSGNKLNMILSGSSQFPNLSSSEFLSCSIYNSIGKEIPISNTPFSILQSPFSIILPDLSDGIYILRLYSQSGNFSISKKFVVKNLR
jgi:hypothetical protein